MSATIAEQVRQLAETMAAQPPSEVMGAFAREQAALAAGDSPEGVINVGTTLPDADLLDPYGASTTLYRSVGSQRHPEGLIPSGQADLGVEAMLRNVPQQGGVEIRERL